MTDTGTTYRKLTPLEWEEIVTLWESGSVTLDVLVERYEASRTALHDGLKKRGAVKGSKAKEYAKRTEDSLKSDATIRAEEVKDFRKKYHGFGDFIMTMTMVELNRLQKESPRTPETQRKIMAHLKMSADIYAKIRDQKFHLYDLYNEREEEADIPEIAVAQYSEEMLEALRKSQEKEEPTEEELLAEAEAALAELMDGKGTDGGL